MLHRSINVNYNLTSGSHIPRRRINSSGFSLIELTVTLAVFALVAALAVPNFRNFVQNNQMSASANNLMGSLALARSEAIKRNTQVSVCASSTQTGCTGADWNNGWIVFVDEDEPGVVDGTDEILNAVQGLPGGMDLSSTDPYIQFKSNGSLAACQFCLLDIGKLRVVSLFESMRMWASRAIFMLLPGKEVFAKDGNKHWAGDGHGHGHGHGCKGGKGGKGCASSTPSTNSTPDTSNPPSTPDTSSTPSTSQQIGVELILCDSQQTNETGRLFFISISGHITESSYGCS